MGKRLRSSFWLWFVMALLLLLLTAPISGRAAEREAPAVLQEAKIELEAPSAILIEAGTGFTICEKNADERRSPASITKIMTLLLTFEELSTGNVKLEDEVIVSEYAASMGGSQVFLAQGERQTLETMIKCIVIASGNDASVAVAEHVAGSEEAFVQRMNERAKQLGMTGTHFCDCCGLSDDPEHYTTARDVAIMSRELIVKYPEVQKYAQIWMEDIVHVTRQGESKFTLSSTNKLLKRYPYTTGLKTGSTSKAGYCISATARKDDMEMIAVILGAKDPKKRFSEAQALLTYGFANTRLYRDEESDDLEELSVKGGIQRKARLCYEAPFQYLDMQGLKFDQIQKEIVLPEELEAPVEKGQSVGYARYLYNGVELGRRPILAEETVRRAGMGDRIRQVFQSWLFS